MVLRTEKILFALATTAWLWPSALLAATKEEAKCLSWLEKAKAAEQVARARSATYQSDRTESNRCALLKTLKSQLETGKQAGKACMKFQPELAQQLIDAADRTIPTMKSSGCRSLR